MQYYLAGFPFTIFLDNTSFTTLEPEPTVTLLEIVKFRPIVDAATFHLMGSGGRSNRTFADMMKVVNNGSLHGIVGKVFPLDSVGAAHQAMDDRDFFGKLVIES